MKEFEFDNNRNINDSDNAGENQTPANESENAPIVTADTKNETAQAENIEAAPEQTPSPEEKKAQPDPITNNPYFSGYSQPRETANRNPGMREYPYGNQQNPNEYRQDRGNYNPNSYNQGNQQGV